MKRATVSSFPSRTSATSLTSPVLQLVCRVDSLGTLRAAVDHGADWVNVRVGERSDTADTQELESAVRHARQQGCKLIVTLDEAGNGTAAWPVRRDLLDRAAAAGVDALETADPALLLYAAGQYPGLALHFPVPGAAQDSAALRNFARRFGIARFVLPRVVSLSQLTTLSRDLAGELQVCGFGQQCTIVDAPEQSTEADSSARGELCASPETAVNDAQFLRPLAPNPTGLRMLPRLQALGVRGVCVEADAGNAAHQAEVTRVWREAIDDCLRDPERYAVKSAWLFALNNAGRRYRHS